MDIQEGYPTCEICKGELHYGELCHVAEGKNYHSTCFVKDAETRLLQMKARLEAQQKLLERVARLYHRNAKGHWVATGVTGSIAFTATLDDIDLLLSAQREESGK
jgi:hypothetical protein